MKSALLAGVALALCGCATRVPVIGPAPKCPVDEKLIATCAAPSEIAVGITFQDMITTLGRDREGLRECTIRQQVLVETITACNAELDRYNQYVRETNERLQKMR